MRCVFTLREVCSGHLNSILYQKAQILSCSGKGVIDFSSLRKDFKEIIKNPGEKNKVLLYPPSGCLNEGK